MAETPNTRVPWYLWCASLAVTSAYVGGYWDISWHRSIGRDSFWSAPHMAIYACGILAGITAAYLIFSTTFGKNAELKDASVRIWGLYGPLGAFICAWGGVAMLASAPFDDWWHNAYGLDVRIISPPHMVLAVGFFGIEFGTVMLMLAFMNRAHASVRPALERMFLYVGGTVLCESLLIKLESISRADQHNARFYIVVLVGTPLILAALAIASERKWASTIIAGVYSVFALAFLWILPLFPAEPKLGPVFRKVTHFIPWEFPLLIIVPAFVMDLIMQRTTTWRPLVRGLVVGVGFFAAFLAVQWPFADFMMTPAARNWFFGSGYLDFATPPRSPLARYEFFYREADGATFWRGMLIAGMVAWFMAWIGMHAGRAMQKGPAVTSGRLRATRYGAPGLVLLLLAAALQLPAEAHVGSPDVFLEGQAGPYRLLVTIRPPTVIPGVADVEVLATSDDVRDVRIVPLPLAGVGAQFAPVPDRAQRSSDDPKLFTGHLWLMGAGAWQVRVTAYGDRGEGTLSVPVPTLPQSTLAMTSALRAILFVFMMLLGGGFVAIVSAMAREARLGPGEVLDSRSRLRGRLAGGIAALVVGGIIFLGNMWWSAEANAYERYVYKPLTAVPSVSADSSLRLELHDPGWIGSRRVDDFVPDHGHLMHLFVLSPNLDRLWHLHPAELRTGAFQQRLPHLPAGHYELFGDLVHATGVSETVTAKLDTTEVTGTPLSGDDSTWSTTDTSATKIVWVRGETPLVPKKITTFTFRVEDDKGEPVRDLELYMGMPGHAVFVRKDRQVFAHVHPSGSAPMAAMEIAMPADASHTQHAGATPSTVTFPYGFPEPGHYRIFVQIKRAGAIVTGAFDADVK